MLYPKNQQAALSDALFENPTSEYRATPFWAWNNKLDKAQLSRQIEALRQMGFGGFHMHSRTGMATRYLSDEFMGMVSHCVQEAREKKMLAWLYDEDRWPSGAAGGYVTQNPAYRARFLVFTPVSNQEYQQEQSVGESKASGTRDASGTLQSRYDIQLAPDGTLASYRRLSQGETAKHTQWYAYLQLAGPSPWYNNQSYVNTLDPKAIQAFIQTTHERYKQTVGRDFGGVVPAIFTDEPQFTMKNTLGFAQDQTDVFLPWTDDVPQTYADAYGGADIWETLPELIWDLPDGAPSLARYRYHDHIAERFASAFADTCGAWCKQNGIMLTGHMMQEPTLQSQTGSLGEAMRSYRAFDLPGIDMLCDRREYTTAKQAQSAAHQYGYPGVLSELYGVTNWDFDLRNHKMQGDWQAALGVTVRVPHLSWVSMAGEAKRDYPASISYQSPWYREYPYIENHFARVNTALTRGKPVVKVGVVHPIESYWLKFGPSEQTALAREELDAAFENVTNWLLFGQIDFDYICESLLAQQCPEGGAPLRVGQMAYDAIVVPCMTTMRKTTFDRLQAFKAAGGTLIILGDAPVLMDAVKSTEIEALKTGAKCLSLSKASLMDALEPLRVIDVRDDVPGNKLLRVPAKMGTRCQDVLYQMRQDGDDRWLFLCHGQKPEHLDVLWDGIVKIRVKGEYAPVLYDTLTGKIRPIGADYVHGDTVFHAVLNPCDSLLVKLVPGRAQTGDARIGLIDRSGEEFTQMVDVTLSEPNVALLDQAQYAFDDGPWQPREEILRIDDAFRRLLDYPLRCEALAQPWVVPDEPPKHSLKLRYRVESAIALKGACLAIENAHGIDLFVNGKPVEKRYDGYYVDESIEKILLPDLPAGTLEIEVRMPFGRRTNPEACYLLGDFGVQLQGVCQTLTPPVRQLAFGDATRQALPFYAGNITYHLPVDPAYDYELAVTHYRGAVVAVDVCGQRQGLICLPPYRLTLRGLPAQAKTIDITLFGNRVNAFGAAHNWDEAVTWHGPNSWRMTDDAWGYGYDLKRFGILVGPRLRKLSD